MPVSAFSIEQDPEVQEYRARRAQHLAQERTKKQAARASRRELLDKLEQKDDKGRTRKWFQRLWPGYMKAVTVHRNVVQVRDLNEDLDWEGVTEVGSMHENMTLKGALNMSNCEKLEASN